MLEQLGRLTRSTELIDSDDTTFRPDELPPAGGHSRFDGNPLSHQSRQHPLLVAGIVTHKRLAGWHRNQAHATATSGELAHRFGRDTDFRPGSDHDAFGQSLALDQCITTASDGRNLVRRALLMRNALAGERERRRAIATLDRNLPGDRGLHRVTG